MSSLACCCNRACLAGVSRSLSELLVSMWPLLFLWESAVVGDSGAVAGNTEPGGVIPPSPMGGMPGGRSPVSSVWAGGRLLRADPLGLLLRPSLTIVS